MKSSDVRNGFINYFKRHGHTHVESSSLIPQNDPTLLFTNAGMNQFKNVFLGLEKRDYTRAVTSQKCVRAGGKHNDLENVGFTARHHTFFEMLGNFSFGEYFKKDAIHFAWELLTKEFGIPKEKLYVTVFETDNEAAEIWHQQEGVPYDRIFRFGEKDNFWRMGDTGPCGPCSEIFYDHGPKAGTESDPYKGILSGQDRFIEIWNLVFMQFYEKSPGVMDPLPRPSVDTGSGLERVVAALEGQYNNYDTDLFSPMIHTACKKSGVDYITDTDLLVKNPKIRSITSALRVMADHCRATGFLLADGALPSNDGRGYVLRRIMRRAIRFGRKLNPSTSILPDMVQSLIEHMGHFYPELQRNKDHILTTVRDEEERFLHTLDQGTQILQDEMNKALRSGLKIISGKTAFKLYDTFGFPLDLTTLIATEQGLVVDEPAFEIEMENSKAKAKKSWKGKGLEADERHLISLAQSSFDKNKSTDFVGYERLTESSTVLALSDGNKEVSQLISGQSGFVILDKSPFYAEGGGQAADQGILKGLNGDLEVFNCIKLSEVFIHSVELKRGEINIGEKVNAIVTTSERKAMARNHSATHLLHAALRKIIGPHVTQAGSLVDSTKLRFDFTHNKSLSIDELEKVENMVNEQISNALVVETSITTHEQAIKEGAMALFGEKYGDQVRVLKMGDFSCELCGGTHVKNTSEILLFKIVSEGSVSSGVRRIEALSGEKASALMLKSFSELFRARQLAGLSETWDKYIYDSTTKSLSAFIEDQKSEIKVLEKEIKQLKGAQFDLNEIVTKSLPFKIGSEHGRLVWAEIETEDRDILAQTADHLKNKVSNGVIVLIGKNTKTNSLPIIVSVTSNLAQLASAGSLLKTICSIMGGKGGGRSDFAQGAVPNLTQANEALGQIKTQLNLN